MPAGARFRPGSRRAPLADSFGAGNAEPSGTAPLIACGYVWVAARREKRARDVNL